MALNPPITTGLPILLQDEVQLTTVQGVDCKIEVEGYETLSAKGKVWLSDKRLVFVCEQGVPFPGGHFRAFDFPLANLSNDTKFNQPVFGCNNLSGQVTPLEGFGLESPVAFRINFKTGGAGSFLRYFFGALSRARREADVAEQNEARQTTDFDLETTAACHPDNPSVVYLVEK